MAGTGRNCDNDDGKRRELCGKSWMVAKEALVLDALVVSC